MNPREYDLDELQSIADPKETGFTFGRNGRESGGGGATERRSRAESVLGENQHRELLLLQSMSAGDLTKPYLEALPATYAAELTVFEWLEFLLTKAGFRRTLDTLRYYRTIGWLTPSVEQQLAEYLRSFDQPTPTDVSDLDRSDHVTSLVYVARLAAIDE